MAGTPPQSPPPTPKASSSFPLMTSPDGSPRIIQGSKESTRVATMMAALRAEKALASRDSIATVLADRPSSDVVTDEMTQARVKAESEAWKAAAPTAHDEEAARANAAIARNALAVAKAEASLAAPPSSPGPLVRLDSAELTLQNQWEAAYRAREDSLENSLERTQTLLEALAESWPSSSGSDKRKWEEVERPRVLVNGRKWQENGGKETKGIVGKAGEIMKGLFGKR
ncbi:hypothetical protein LTR95_001704 [Oleoguttula sp. CCFEE 5521]